MNANARALNERQCKYDKLHHQARVKHFESLPHLDSFQRGLLKQSREVLAQPGLLGHNSVDLSGTDYIAELDRFAAEANSRSEE